MDDLELLKPTEQTMRHKKEKENKTDFKSFCRRNENIKNSLHHCAKKSIMQRPRVSLFLYSVCRAMRREKKDYSSREKVIVVAVK